MSRITFLKIVLISLLLQGHNLIAQLTYPYNFTYNGNPLVRMHGAADPDVHVWNDTIWMYCSQDQDPFPDNPGYASMDGYHAFSSVDMVNWTDHGEILHSRDVSWGKDGYMWAPGAAYKNGTYYLYYPHRDLSDTWRIGIATSDTPAGPFTDIGAPMQGITGIDPAVFIDDDGQAYLYNNSAIVAKLASNMTELAEAPRKINYGPGEVKDDELLRFNEGSYMHKRDGIYYYSYTNWHNKEYQGFYAMGDNPYGPFEWKGPMAPNPQRAQNHHSIIEFKGQWYYFYHIADSDFPVFKTGQGRIACFDRLYYNKDGTIQEVVHTYGPTNILTTEAPDGLVILDPPGGAYAAGNEVTVTARGDLGFAFDAWGGDLSGTENPATITMGSDKHISASFDSVAIYSLTTDAVHGTISRDPPGEQYSDGDRVSLTVDAAYGYRFSSWSGDLSGSENPVEIVMDSDKSVSANFTALSMVTLEVEALNGIVEIDPPGGTYEEGTEVQLKAVADFGYTFNGWSGGLSGSENPVSIVMDSDKDIAASFIYGGGDTIAFAVNCGGDAYRTGDGIQYIKDDYFSGGGTYASGSPISNTGDDTLYQSERNGNFNYSIPLADGNYEVTLLFAEVFFSEAGKRLFNVSIEGDEVISNLDIWEEAGKNAAYTISYAVTVNDGKLDIAFNTIKDNAKISAIKVLHLVGDVQYELETISVNGDIVLDPPGGFYELGTEVTLTAEPELGYLFNGWSGDLTGTGNPAMLVMNSDKVVAAAFQQAAICFLVADAENGSIVFDPPGQAYTEGTSVTVTAVADTGYLFVEWNGDLSGFQNPENVLMDGNKNIVALFAVNDNTALQEWTARREGGWWLGQNYPNPFSERTTIPFRVDQNSHVDLAIYNILGVKVEQLVDLYLPAGNYESHWDGQSGSGESLPGGMYLYCLAVETSGATVRKMRLQR